MIQKSIEEWMGKDKDRIKYLTTQSIRPLMCPKSIDPINKIYDMVNKNPRPSKKFCVEIDNVYVVNGKIVDASISSEIEEFCRCGNLCNPSKNITIDYAVHLVDQWAGTNYWHWMSTGLAKLFMISNWSAETVFIVNSLGNHFVKESLSKMGISLSKCIEVDKVGSVFCRKLMALSPISDNDSEGLCFLRDKLSNKNSTSVRLYISRKHSRRIENENEIMSVLNEYGFVKIQCEELSFEKQADIFSNAEMVMAPHGAGLTNILFAPGNVRVLEVRSPRYFGSCYWKLCNHLGVQYYSLFGEGRFPRDRKSVV